MKVWKGIALFAGGTLFGLWGIKMLCSKDAKKVYTHCTAGVLRAKDYVMDQATDVKENCCDIYEEAKVINEERAAKEKESEVEDEAEEIVEEVVEEAKEEKKAKRAAKKEEIKEAVEEVKEKKEEVKKAVKAKKEEIKEEVKEVKKEVKAKKEKVEDLASLTLADLKAKAKELGIKGYSTMKKADLVEALKK